MLENYFTFLYLKTLSTLRFQFEHLILVAHAQEQFFRHR
jgi:hypothetical protein